MDIIAAIMQQKDEITGIVFLSLLVSGTATLISSFIALPLGAYLGLYDFKGRRLVLRLVYTLMALPPVLAGLVVFLLLSRSGPLGFLNLLFTPGAMIIAQCLLVLPIVTGLVAAAVASAERLVYEHALSLGATHYQAVGKVLLETRSGIISAIMTGFGRAFAEVGAVMMVGGNIRYETRVLTTAIVTETRSGNFEMAIALGIILLLLSFLISWIVLTNADDLRDVAR
ncbi:tungstate transport system permease protein [Thermosyntropha lipolytica DSM 11003]|uniref:Tungstate transport system permease protein n=1 Tax=Thermosyntropha lipolytica DSM 11003 TaxID=1123382 RepID=A0A1M5NC10_9FIRM|nr:ABC transporter permease [Thermosyntropha lipolytica]SHG87104.1 tungstate transport system permease protein [Thermosyntropha lipolytica DSM 11003]